MCRLHHWRRTEGFQLGSGAELTARPGKHPDEQRDRCTGFDVQVDIELREDVPELVVGGLVVVEVVSPLSGSTGSCKGEHR